MLKLFASCGLMAGAVRQKTDIAEKILLNLAEAQKQAVPNWSTAPGSETYNTNPSPMGNYADYNAFVGSFSTTDANGIAQANGYAASKVATEAKTRAAVAAMDSMNELLNQEIEQLKSDVDAEEKDFKKDKCQLDKTIDEEEVLARQKTDEASREGKTMALNRGLQNQYEQQESKYKHEIEQVTKLKTSKETYKSKVAGYLESAYQELIHVATTTQSAIQQLENMKDRIFVNSNGNLHAMYCKATATAGFCHDTPDDGKTCTHTGTTEATCHEAEGCTWKPANYPCDVDKTAANFKKADEAQDGDTCGIAHSDDTSANASCVWDSHELTANKLLLQESEGTKPMKPKDLMLLKTELESKVKTKAKGIQCTSDDDCKDKQDVHTIRNDYCETSNPREATCTLHGACLRKDVINGDGDAVASPALGQTLYSQFADQYNITETEQDEFVACITQDQTGCASDAKCVYKMYTYDTSPDEAEARGAHAVAAIIRIAADLEKQAINEMRRIAFNIKTDEEMYQKMATSTQEQITRLTALETQANSQEQHFKGLADAAETARDLAEAAATAANAAAKTARDGLRARQEAWETFSTDARQTLQIYDTVLNMVHEFLKIYNCKTDSECLGNPYNGGNRNYCSMSNTWRDIAGAERQTCVACENDTHCSTSNGYENGYVCDNTGIAASFMCKPSTTAFLQTGAQVNAPTIYACHTRDTHDKCMGGRTNPATGQSSDSIWPDYQAVADGSQCYWDEFAAGTAESPKCRSSSEEPAQHLIAILKSMKHQEHKECRKLERLDGEIADETAFALTELKEAKLEQFQRKEQMEDYLNFLQTKNAEKAASTEALNKANEKVKLAVEQCNLSMEHLKNTIANVVTQENAMRSLSSTVLGLVSSYNYAAKVNNELGTCHHADSAGNRLKEGDSGYDATYDKQCQELSPQDNSGCVGVKDSDENAVPCTMVLHAHYLSDGKVERASDATDFATLGKFGGAGFKPGFSEINTMFDNMMTSLANLRNQQNAELAALKTHCDTEIATLRQEVKRAEDDMNTQTIELAKAQHQLLMEQQSVVQSVETVNFAYERLAQATNTAKTHLGVCESAGGPVDCDDATKNSCSCLDGPDGQDPANCPCTNLACTCMVSHVDAGTLSDAGQIVDTTKFNCGMQVDKCMGAQPYCKGATDNPAGDSKGCTHLTTKTSCTGATTYDNLTADTADDVSVKCEWITHTESKGVCADSCVWHDQVTSKSTSNEDGALTSAQVGGPNSAVTTLSYFDQAGVALTYKEAVNECNSLQWQIHNVVRCLEKFLAAPIGTDMAINSLAECSDNSIQEADCKPINNNNAQQRQICANCPATMTGCGPQVGFDLEPSTDPCHINCVFHPGA